MNVEFGSVRSRVNLGQAVKCVGYSIDQSSVDLYHV